MKFQSELKYFLPVKTLKELNQQLHIRTIAIIFALLANAGIHLADLPSKWPSETRYIAFLYMLSIGGSIFLIERFVTKISKRDCLFVAFVFFSVLLGYVINRSIGMPNAMEDIGNWWEPLGLLSLFVDVFGIWHALNAYRTIGLIEEQLRITEKA